MRHLSRHTDALAKRGMRVNRLANVHRIRSHLDGQRNLANHVASVGADHAAARDGALAPVGMAVVRSIQSNPGKRPTPYTR